VKCLVLPACHRRYTHVSLIFCACGCRANHPLRHHFKQESKRGQTSSVLISNPLIVKSEGVLSLLCCLFVPWLPHLSLAQRTSLSTRSARHCRDTTRFRLASHLSLIFALLCQTLWLLVVFDNCSFVFINAVVSINKSSSLYSLRLYTSFRVCLCQVCFLCIVLHTE